MSENRQTTPTPRPPLEGEPPHETAELVQTEHRIGRAAWKRRVGAVLLLVCGLVMVGALVRTLVVTMTREAGVEPVGVVTDSEHRDALASLAQFSAASQLLSERIRRSVVRVEATDIRMDAAEDELAQLFGPSPPAFGQGSGVIVEADGYVLTNYHVIRGAREICVIVDGTRRFPATVVGSDALTDLAVLRIESHRLDCITWGNSDQLQVGAVVWAIGSPFGLEGSVSFGIVSAKNRDSLDGNPFQAFLQTDAAVNPGNSGGPLVDASGRVVGINTAILGQTFQGISFSIPSSTARAIYLRLKQHGWVARGWLGISLDPLTPQRAAQLNVEEGRGVYVVSVAGDASRPAPAWEAGIRPGDVLTHWNGQPLEDPIQFSRIVAQSPVNSQAEVTLIRDEQKMKLALVVGERPH